MKGQRNEREAMVKVMTRKKQNEAFKKLVNIIIELGRRSDDDAVYAIGDAFEIVEIIGGRGMFEALGCQRPLRVNSIRQELSNGFAGLIDCIDDIIG